MAGKDNRRMFPRIQAQEKALLMRALALKHIDR
jgi:hypothetical protein